MSNQVDLGQLAIERDRSGAAAPRPRRSLLTRYVLPGGLLLGFLLLLGWAMWDVVFPPRSVTVVPVLATQSHLQSEGTPLFQAAGWIEPRPTPVRAAALAPGVVEQLLVVEDQPVKKGEPVAELVKDDAQLVYEAALANQQLAEAQLDEARAGLEAATTRLEQPVHLAAPLGEADSLLAKVETLLTNLPFEIREAEAQHEFARKDHEGKLKSKGAVSGRAIDEAKSRMDAAAAQLNGLRDREASLKKEHAALSARRDALRTQLELLADEIKAKDEAASHVAGATARAEQARVAVAQAKLQLDRMTVRSPIDGRVFRLIAHPGARIGAGMTQMTGHDGSTVVTLYRPKMLQIRVDARFEDIPKVSLGQPVEIDNPALDSPLAGRVLFVSSEADIQKNTLQVKVAIDDPPEVFKPEMLVDVTFLAPQRSGEAPPPTEQIRLFVPQSLVQEGEGGPFVWLADQSAGRARRTPIGLGGSALGGLVEVKTGLKPGSRIIVSPLDGLADGERIRIAGEGEATGGGP
jgi:RND family efflux transporter MFP subunit